MAPLVMVRIHAPQPSSISLKAVPKDILRSFSGSAGGLFVYICAHLKTPCIKTVPIWDLTPITSITFYFPRHLTLERAYGELEASSQALLTVLL